MFVTAKLATAAARMVCSAIAAAVTPRFTVARWRQPQPFDGEALQVSFPARDGGARIDGWYLTDRAPAAGRPAVVLVADRGARRGDAQKPPTLGRAQALATAGIAVLLIEGRSGSPTHSTDRERFDLLGAMDWLRERGHRPIGSYRADPGVQAERLLGLFRGHLPGRVAGGLGG